jgi:hypothetical protein
MQYSSHIGLALLSSFAAYQIGKHLWKPKPTKKGVFDPEILSQLILFVESKAKRGNPKQVLDAIDEFVSRPENLTMVVGKEK